MAAFPAGPIGIVVRDAAATKFDLATIGFFDQLRSRIAVPVRSC
jgi:hypothetical protein